MNTQQSSRPPARRARQCRLRAALRAVLLAPAAVMMSAATASGISGDVVKIGILNDQSGTYADLAGPGSVEARPPSGWRSATTTRM